MRPPVALVLTVLVHPNADRIGERAVLPWRPGSEWVLSRLAPDFCAVDGAVVGPLADRAVSRRPLSLRIDVDGLHISSEAPLAYALAGRAMDTRALIPLHALVEGQSLRCGRRVALWIEARAAAPVWGEAGSGVLAGSSAAIEAVRARIGLVAPLPFPVSIHGPADSGRVAVARLLHDRGPRSTGTWTPVGVGAVDDALTATSTAQTTGTLFISNVERLADDTQQRLLSWIEAHGASGRWRLVTSTTDDLEALAGAGRFSTSLAYRLRSARIDMPPLRDRIADVPRLFVDALRGRLAALNLPDRVVDGADMPWLRARLVEDLVTHGWPGNLRELHNLALEVALGSHAEAEARPPAGWSPRPPTPAPVHPRLNPNEPPGPATPNPWVEAPDTRAWAVPPDALRATLARHGWRVRQASADLGVSRNTVYAMMGRLGIRRPSDLDPADIIAAVEAEGSTRAEAVARRLQVSTHGLRMRLAALGMTLT